MSLKRVEKRRIFLGHNEEYFKLFTFSQKDDKDGSIYCHWPDFIDTKWIEVESNPNELKVSTIDTPSNSKKLSLHGSGLVKFTQDKIGSGPLQIQGSQLLDSKKNEISPRHLFTCILKTPTDKSQYSPYGNRESDYVINASEFVPFVILFFAIPMQKVPITTHFQINFNTQFFDSDIGKNFGYDSFPLKQHDIIWIIYRPKKLKSWPKHNYMMYTDGFLVPAFFINDEKQESKELDALIVIQEPTYKLEENNLFIYLPFSYGNL